VRLVGVVDADARTAESVANEFGTKAYGSPHELLGKVDGVCIATPTVHHRAAAEEFLKAGIAALVEKPLSLSVEDGRWMVEQAKRSGAALMVGQVERFNPVWRAVEESRIRPQFVDATRHSRYPFRSLDVSVVYDLMIHDLDLILAATGSRVQSIQAVGGAVLSPSTDWAEVRLELQGGAIANLSASRVHHATERRMRLSSDRQTIEVDFVKRWSVRSAFDGVSARARLSELPAELTQEEKDRVLNEVFDVGCIAHDRDVEPLRLELEEFAAAIREDRDPKVPGEAGLEAVAAADAIDRAIRRRERSTPLCRSA
jgi:predicted dehydrogenase